MTPPYCAACGDWCVESHWWFTSDPLTFYCHPCWRVIADVDRVGLVDFAGAA